MFDKKFYLSLAITFVLMGTVCGATYVVDYIQARNTKFRVAVLILTYPKDSNPTQEEMTIATNQAKDKWNSKHTVVLPDMMVPIAIPKNRFQEIKKILGPSCLLLDPSIECETVDCK